MPPAGEIEQKIANRQELMLWRKWVRNVEALHQRRQMTRQWRWLYM